jgi:hypothetical protein
MVQTNTDKRKVSVNKTEEKTKANPYDTMDVKIYGMNNNAMMSMHKKRLDIVEKNILRDLSMDSIKTLAKIL